MIPYLTKIEYIETSGNCLYTTSCIPQGGNIKISTKFLFNGWTTNSNYTSWYRAYTNESSQVYRIMRNSASTHVMSVPNGTQANGSANDCPFTASIGTTYTIETDGRSVTVNGTTHTTPRAIASSVNTSPMQIFHTYFKGRFYYMKIYDGDELILDLFPVRIGNKGYLYDALRNELIDNSLTGTPTLGPDTEVLYANEIAFLESTGSQYIDTGITCSNNSKVELKVMANGTQTYTSGLFGSRNYTTDVTNAFHLYSFVTGIQFGFNNLSMNITGLTTQVSHVYTLDKNIYYIDGGQEGSFTDATFTCPTSALLFTTHTGSDGTEVDSRIFKGKLYYCKIWNGDTLVRDYIPVEYNNIGYLYDKVSRKFFANQGTGKFVLGHRAPRFDGKACARSYTRRQLMAKAPEEDWSKHYLTFKVLSEGTITIVTTAAAQAKTIQYSVDNGSTWASITSSTTVQSLGDFSAGDEMLIKGNNSAYSDNVSRYNYFGGTAKVELRGNIMSLTYGDNFDDKTSYSASFAICGLFHSYTNLVSAKKLVLPATTLTDRCYLNLFLSCTALKEPPAVLPATVCKGLCYQGMFQGCSSLLYIPYFKVSTMAPDCFNSMFRNCSALTDLSNLEISSTNKTCCICMFAGCTSLTTKVPQLSAKTLATNCYGYMFDGCSNLTKAPDLPALTLVSNCYQRMFRNCSKLNYIKAMFTTTPSTSYTNVWVSGVASRGTFVKNSAATWDVRGTSGIPNNWTVQTADE